MEEESEGKKKNVEYIEEGKCATEKGDDEGKITEKGDE